MNLKLIVAILVIATVPVRAQAQHPSAAKLRADAQKVVKIISSDKAKTQTFCDIGKLGEQVEEANEKKDGKTADELSRKIKRIREKTGSRICHVDGRASGR